MAATQSDVIPASDECGASLISAPRPSPPYTGCERFAHVFHQSSCLTSPSDINSGVGVFGSAHQRARFEVENWSGTIARPYPAIHKLIPSEESSYV